MKLKKPDNQVILASLRSLQQKLKAVGKGTSSQYFLISFCTHINQDQNKAINFLNNIKTATPSTSQKSTGKLSLQGTLASHIIKARWNTENEFI